MSGFIPYHGYITPDPNEKENKSMTMVPRPEPGRPSVIAESTRKKREDAARADRQVTRIRLDQATAEARAQAEELKRTMAIRAAQRAHRIDLHEKQEAVRAPQFQIDQRGTLFLLLGLTTIMFITSAVLSADGTIGASTAAHYAVGWFGYLLFGAVEVAVLVFMLSYYILGSRTDYEGNPVRATQWFVAMIVASFMAVGLSVFHVLDVYRFDWSSIEMWVGVAIRLAVTIFFVVCSKAAATVLFAKPVRL
jgi:hypothetical protein